MFLGLNSLSFIDDLSTITSLIIADTSLSNITGLENCNKNITTLKLTNNSISDLRALESIINNGTTKLTSLKLKGNTIKNVSDSGNDNILTLVKIHNSELNLDLSENLLYDGQADDLESLYGDRLTISYIQET